MSLEGLVELSELGQSLVCNRRRVRTYRMPTCRSGLFFIFLKNVITRVQVNPMARPEKKLIHKIQPRKLAPISIHDPRFRSNGAHSLVTMHILEELLHRILPRPFPPSFFVFYPSDFTPEHYVIRCLIPLPAPRAYGIIRPPYPVLPPFTDTLPPLSLQ